MRQGERFEILILGSGEAGKLLAWHRRRDRRGGPAVDRLPSKNEIRSAKVAHLARHATEFGTMTGPP